MENNMNINLVDAKDLMSDLEVLDHIQRTQKKIRENLNEIACLNKEIAGKIFILNLD